MRLFALLACALLLRGCSGVAKGPVYGWDWSGPVPTGFYLVKRGDTLGEVAERFGVNSRTLANWNRLERPYTIYAGTLLRVAPLNDRRPAPVVDGLSSRPPAALEGEASAESRRAPLPVAEPQPQAAAVDEARSEEASGSRRDASEVPWDWPLGGRLVQRFGSADPTRQGIRIAGHPGEPVRASAAGEVAYSGGGLKGYGNLIIIKHNDKYLSAYGFNRRLYVTEGDRVKRGQVVAEVGASADGVYLLHFEIRRYGTAVDPLLYLPPRD